MADEAFLNSLSPADALRYKAFISSGFNPRDIGVLLSDTLPPSGLLDAKCHERLLLALAAAARVFVLDTLECAMELRGGDTGAAALPLAPGHLQEAWRRRLLQGEVLGVGEALQPSAEAVRGAAARGGVAAGPAGSAQAAAGAAAAAASSK